MPKFTNFVTNPRARSTLGWNWSTAVGSELTQKNTGFSDSGYVEVKFTSAGASDAAVTTSAEVPAASLTTGKLSLGIEVYSSKRQPFVGVFTYFNVDNEVLAVVHTDTVVCQASQYVRLAVNGNSPAAVVPAGTVYVTLAVSVVFNEASPWAVGDFFRVSRAIATDWVTDEPGFDDYFDGSSYASVWLGTPDAGRSQITKTWPVLVPYTDYSPSPRVEITYAELLPATQEVTIFAITSELTRAVRESVRSFASGGVQFVDTEVPLGVPVTYKAMQYDAAGNEIGYTDSATTQVNAEIYEAALSDPLNPNLAVRVEIDSAFGGDLDRRSDYTKYRVGDRTIALLGAERLLEDLSLTFNTDSKEAADTVVELVQTRVILVRTAPPVRVPRSLYVVIPQARERDVTTQLGGAWVTWELTADELSHTDQSPVLPLYSYQDYMDAGFTTYGEAMGVWSTYFDARVNPPEKL